jgi:hypothetical protein
VFVVVVVVVVVVVGFDSVVSSVVIGASVVSVGEGVTVVSCVVVVLVVGVVVVVVLRLTEEVVLLGAVPGSPCGDTESRDTCTTANTSAAITRRPPTPATNAIAGRWYHGAWASSSASSDTRWIVG